MSYDTTVIFLCETFGSSSPPAADETELGKPDLRYFQPQTLIHSAMDSLGGLILCYRDTHGKSMPVVMLHYLVVAGVYSLHRLQPNEPKGARKWGQILTACVSGLLHMSLRWPLCHFLLRTIQLLVRSSPGVVVPDEVSAIFDEIDSKIWTPGTTKSLLSTYILHQVPDRVPVERATGPRPSRRGRTEALKDVIMSLDNLATC